MNRSLLDITRRILKLERRVDNLVQPERGWHPHFLTTPYTNADFDGDSFSDVGSNTKIENTSWSTTIPSNAKALLIVTSVRDSDSAATSGLFFALYPSAAAANYAMICRPSGKANDDLASSHAIVPCTDGDIWYRANASGADTLDVYLWCFGYWT